MEMEDDVLVCEVCGAPVYETTEYEGFPYEESYQIIVYRCCDEHDCTEPGENQGTCDHVSYNCMTHKEFKEK